jgi:histidine triad (HIT) family protein
MTEETIFTKIINGDIPSECLYEDDQCICIRDIAPKAPVHLLLIPRKPIPRLVDAKAEDKELLGHLLLKAGEIARQVGVGDSFRVITNNGESAGQTVFHLHFHILADQVFSEEDMT